jgi:hypothetical protein
VAGCSKRAAIWLADAGSSLIILSLSKAGQEDERRFGCFPWSDEDDAETHFYHPHLALAGANERTRSGCPFRHMKAISGAMSQDNKIYASHPGVCRSVGQLGREGMQGTTLRDQTVLPGLLGKIGTA